MPDLTIEHVYVCSSNTAWSTDIVGSKGDLHLVTWERDYSPRADTQYHYVCDCRGYKFNHKCPHIAEADKLRCKWNEEMSPGAQPVVIEGEPRCPECKGYLDVLRVAV